MLVCFWSPKGGSGTSASSAAAAAGARAGRSGASRRPRGDQPAISVSRSDPDPGLRDWLRIGPEAPTDALRSVRGRCRQRARAARRGQRRRRDHTARGRRCARGRTRKPTRAPTIADVGPARPAPRRVARARGGGRRARDRGAGLLLCAATRDARRAHELGGAGVVFVDEPGRSLGARDVASVLGLPILATVALRVDGASDRCGRARDATTRLAGSRGTRCAAPRRLDPQGSGVSIPAAARRCTAGCSDVPFDPRTSRPTSCVPPRDRCSATKRPSSPDAAARRSSTRRRRRRRSRPAAGAARRSRDQRSDGQRPRARLRGAQRRSSKRCRATSTPTRSSASCSAPSRRSGCGSTGPPRWSTPGSPTGRGCTRCCRRFAPDGPCITIRRFAVEALTLADFGLRPAEARVPRRAGARDGTSSSAARPARARPPRANASHAIDPVERIVTIEETAELRLRHPHVVRLEARPPTPRASARSGCANSCALRCGCGPTDLVVGEVRGGEAFGHAAGAQHRPRRVAVDGARELARRRARSARDARAPRRGRAAAGRRAQPARGRSTRSCRSRARERTSRDRRGRRGWSAQGAALSRCVRCSLGKAMRSPPWRRRTATGARAGHELESVVGVHTVGRADRRDRDARARAACPPVGSGRALAIGTHAPSPAAVLRPWLACAARRRRGVGAGRRGRAAVDRLGDRRAGRDRARRGGRPADRVRGAGRAPGRAARARSRRSRLMAAAIPDALERVGAELRAGGTVPTALTALTHEDGPLAADFARVETRVGLGASLSAALEAWARERLSPVSRRPPVRWRSASVSVVDAARARRARGVVARPARGRAEVRALSAQARYSAWVIGVAPIGYFLATAVIDPRPLARRSGPTSGASCAGRRRPRGGRRFVDAGDPAAAARGDAGARMGRGRPDGAAVSALGPARDDLAAHSPDARFGGPRRARRLPVPLDSVRRVPACVRRTTRIDAATPRCAPSCPSSSISSRSRSRPVTRRISRSSASHHAPRRGRCAASRGPCARARPLARRRTQRPRAHGTGPPAAR